MSDGPYLEDVNTVRIKMAMITETIEPVPDEVVDRLINDKIYMCPDCGHLPRPLRLDVWQVIRPVTCLGDPCRGHAEADHISTERVLVTRCENTPAIRECPDCIEAYGDEDCPWVGEDLSFAVPSDEED